jgi:hypothetical protein
LAYSTWGGLADDLPTAARSVLQPQVEALARGDDLPEFEHRGSKQPGNTELSAG